MTLDELDEEIEYVYDNKNKPEFVRDYRKMCDTMLEVTDTYTNIYTFAIDYIILYTQKKINRNVYIAALNDLYLLALLFQRMSRNE